MESARRCMGGWSLNKLEPKGVRVRGAFGVLKISIPLSILTMPWRSRKNERYQKLWKRISLMFHLFRKWKLLVGIFWPVPEGWNHYARQLSSFYGVKLYVKMVIQESKASTKVWILSYWKRTGHWAINYPRKNMFTDKHTEKSEEEYGS